MRWNAYSQSKLADLMLALELDRRLRASGSTIKSLAAHPGYAATNLQTAAPPLLDRLVMQVTNVLVAQSADMGALPTLYAATEPGLEGGAYVGPDGIGEFRGHPHVVTPSRAARDEAVGDAPVGRRCEELTGVHFELGAAAAAYRRQRAARALRAIARVPNSSASAGRRSFGAWISSMNASSGGSCIGRKPYVWMPRREKKRPSVTAGQQHRHGPAAGSSSRSVPASVSNSPRSGSAATGS